MPADRGEARAVAGPMLRRATWRQSTVAVAGHGPEWEVPFEMGGARWSASLVEVHYAREPIPLALTASVRVQERKA